MSNEPNYPPNPPVLGHIPPQPMTNDRRGLGIAGFVFGTASLVAWCIPLFGFPTSVVGIVLSALGLGSSARGMAVAGLVMSVVGLLASIVNGLLGAAIALDSM